MKLVWDKSGSRLFETGVDMGVLYRLSGGRYSSGVAWNGLIGVSESPSGAEATPLYADDIKYLNLISTEEFEGTIEAYNYPDKFRKCLGEFELAPGVFVTQQPRSHFGMVYRTHIGNDTEGSDYAYKIHMIFDCIAKPSEKAYGTINDTPEAITLSWEITTTPILAEGFKPTSTLVLDSLRFRKAGMSNVLHYIEGVIFGTDNTDPRLPSISEILEAFDLQINLRDSINEALLDSLGNEIQSSVYS